MAVKVKVWYESNEVRAGILIIACLAAQIIAAHLKIDFTLPAEIWLGLLTAYGVASAKGRGTKIVKSKDAKKEVQNANIKG